MNAHFGLAKVALLAAASVSLIAVGSAAAQSQGSGGPSQPVPYADTSQRDTDTDYRTPPQPPPPPPPPAQPAISYAPNSDSRFAPSGEQPGYRAAPPPQCRLIEQRAFYPDGTTESRSVQACRGPSGRWHVVD